MSQNDSRSGSVSWHFLPELFQLDSLTTMLWGFASGATRSAVLMSSLHTLGCTCLKLVILLSFVIHCFVICCARMNTLVCEIPPVQIRGLTIS